MLYISIKYFYYFCLRPDPTHLLQPSVSVVFFDPLSTNLKSRHSISGEGSREKVRFVMTIVATLFESTKDKCYAPSFIAVNLCLAFIDAALAFIAFLQVSDFLGFGLLFSWNKKERF